MKTKTPRFTFKKHERPTGLMAVGHPYSDVDVKYIHRPDGESRQHRAGHPYSDVDVKYNKRKIAIIGAPHWASKSHHWRIQIAVKREPTKDHPCPFEWKYPKEKFATEQAARDWLQTNAAKIVALDLHCLDD